MFRRIIDSGALSLLTLAIPLACGLARATRCQDAVHRPNVVLVMTDDQGFGDFGFVGNPVIRTPHLDRLAASSAQLSQFYVSPVCTPTRAALMTGRYPQRTRAIDTYLGRAMMEPDEVTIAEVLRAAGYSTAIFGKWHLGDCHPMRPIDQGFDTSLVHRGGGIGQSSDPPGGEGRYTDPILFRDGHAERARGYCTDVYFDEALDWMRSEHEAGRPFFCYIATNAPHAPFHDVPEELRARYLADGLGADRFPSTAGGHPPPTGFDADRLARIYAMIENIDQNVGRLLEDLRSSGCFENTLILFLVDNGPQGRRYLAGHRGAKSTPYEGGIRSPLLAHWPDRLKAGIASDRVAAHIDVMPTILDACGVPAPNGVDLDGRSLLPLLERRATEWPDRAVVLQAHRGDRPVRYHNFALRTQRWKLVSATGFGRDVDQVDPRFELFDMSVDGFETRDVAAQQPALLAELRASYDAWFDDIDSSPEAFEPPRIVVGTEQEPVTVLTRQDWRRIAGLEAQSAQGEWLVDIRASGRYSVTIRLPPQRTARRGTFRCDAVRAEFALVDGTSGARFETDLPAGPAALRIELDDEQGHYGAHQVELALLPDIRLGRTTDPALAERFANLALDCVRREYPNKVAHVLRSDDDARPPRELTPAFFGCYDWHSAVHGHWLLVRLLRTAADAEWKPRARAALRSSLTVENLLAEIAYLEGDGRQAWERPYGLAWLLQLASELRGFDDPDAARWSAAIGPLETAVAQRLARWLPKLSHPNRTGEHSQTAFAMGLALDWARARGDDEFATLVATRAIEFHGEDRGWPLRFEPSGQDFLSPGLAAADLMRRVLPDEKFAAWLTRALPDLPHDGSLGDLVPAIVTDPTDGKLAHLDGLNLSRAWMLEGIASHLPADDPRLESLRRAASEHRRAGLAAVTGEHYEGGHWLGSFAVYLVTERGLSPR